MACTRAWRALALSALLVLAGARAQALSISGIAIAPAAGNTANASGTNGANRFQIASATSIVGSTPGPVADLAGAAFLLPADLNLAIWTGSYRFRKIMTPPV